MINNRINEEGQLLRLAADELTLPAGNSIVYIFYNTNGILASGKS